MFELQLRFLTAPPPSSKCDESVE